MKLIFSLVLALCFLEAALGDSCGANAEYHFCSSACGPTCAVPRPIRLCPQSCEDGCICKSGYLKNEDGQCVPAKECARSTADKCLKETEEFQQCAGCDDSCDDDDKHKKLCTRVCVPGCACKKGLVRDSKQRCIPKSECSKEVEHRCPTENEVWTDCGWQINCLVNCNFPQLPEECDKRRDWPCGPGCSCKYPKLRRSDGTCVEKAQCNSTDTI